jgi:predicted N-acetyltransferase YhbS
MVSTTRDGQVAGFYCLSSNALIRESTPEALTKGQPNPVPVVLLGRMGVDLQFRDAGLGWSLLQHATSRALEAAGIIGVHAVLVDALSDEDIPFYERFGFTRFPGSSRALYLLTKDAAATLSAG